MAEVKLYNANEGLTGRGNSIFSDREEQKAAEERNAQREGREPDYENPRTHIGTTLVTASQLIEAATVNSPAALDSGKQAAEDAIIEASPVEHVATIEVPDEEEVQTSAGPASENPEDAEEVVVEDAEADPFEGTEASKE